MISEYVTWKMDTPRWRITSWPICWRIQLGNLEIAILKPRRLRKPPGTP